MSGSSRCWKEWKADGQVISNIFIQLSKAKEKTSAFLWQDASRVCVKYAHKADKNNTAALTNTLHQLSVTSEACSLNVDDPA